MWLVLLTMLGMACLPLVHNHVHHHGSASDAAVWQDAADQDARAHSDDSHPPVSQTDDCTVCAHHDRNCPLILATRALTPSQARAPPSLCSLDSARWPPAAWALPASRAPPALHLSSSPRLA